MLLVLYVCGVIATSQAFTQDWLQYEKWDGFKVTWGMNPLNSNYFADMPRTESDARKEGFHKISECSTTAMWRGARYVKGDDYAVILLFDVNGYIAGIQTSFQDNQTNGYPKSAMRPPFVKDGDRVTLSAYFVDPSIICTTGRSASDFASQGTGTNLYLQMTERPEGSTVVPLYQDDVAGTQWTLGKCFVTMGTHYWYNISKNMRCDDFYPYFLLYNARKLTGFGWAMNADLHSPRYEHPTQRSFSKFMKTPPTCLYDAGALTTMHIYLTSSVAYNVCLH